MSRNKRVILHIGMLKTGTTSLQSYLQRRCDALSEQGVGCYIQQYSPHATWANAGFLCWQSVFDARGNGDKLPNSMEEMELFAEYAKGYDTLILSEEFLWEMGIEEAGFWSAVKRNIHRLVGEDAQIDIIVFLRRQDDWILSRWKERLLSWPHREHADFSDYLERMEKMGHMDYDVALERIAQVFGREHITVCSYGRKDGKKIDTTKTFLTAIGMRLAPLEKTEMIFGNTSISMRAAKAILDINRRDEDDVVASRKKIVRATRIFSSMYPDEEQYYPMKREERIAFLSRFNDINNSVSLEYKHGEELFEKEISDYSLWNDNPEQSEMDANRILKIASISDDTMTLLHQQLMALRH